MLHRPSPSSRDPPTIEDSVRARLQRIQAGLVQVGGRGPGRVWSGGLLSRFVGGARELLDRHRGIDISPQDRACRRGRHGGGVLAGHELRQGASVGRGRQRRTPSPCPAEVQGADATGWPGRHQRRPADPCGQRRVRGARPRELILVEGVTGDVAERTSPRRVHPLTRCLRGGELADLERHTRTVLGGPIPRWHGEPDPDRAAGAAPELLLPGDGPRRTPADPQDLHPAGRARPWSSRSARHLGVGVLGRVQWKPAGPGQVATQLVGRKRRGSHQTRELRGAVLLRPGTSARRQRFSLPHRRGNGPAPPTTARRTGTRPVSSSPATTSPTRTGSPRHGYTSRPTATPATVPSAPVGPTGPRSG